MRVSRGITQDAEFEELGRRGYEGNLNDRQYKLLGNMGLRGALTDRIGSSSISAYALAAVDNKLPPLVMDFKEEDYFSNNTIGSFAEVAEHSRAGNATMTDSSGNIVWAPHNLLTYSEDFSNAAWVKGNTTVTPNAAVAPDGTQTADEISHTSSSASINLYASGTGGDGVSHTFGVYLKYVDHPWFYAYVDSAYVWANIQTGTIGTDQTDGATLTSVGDGWYYLSVPEAQVGPAYYLQIGLATGDLQTLETVGTSAYIWGAHLYRSDLGGMADVPASERAFPTATKYVRTAGRVIGSELVTNGSFDSDLTGWTDVSTGTGTVALTSNAVVLTGPDTSNRGKIRSDNFATVSGAVYELKYEVVATSGTSADLQIQPQTSSGTNLADVFGPAPIGDYVVSFVAASSLSRLEFNCYDDSVTIDNISVKEIDVNPAAARYLPRRGHHVYNGSQWVNKGLLVESEARTNLVTYSEDFTQWTASNNPTLTANATTSPDGNMGGTALLANGTGGFQQIVLTPTLADNTDYCFSVFYKAAVGNSGVRLALKGKDGVTRYFGALSDGSLSTPSGATNVIINTLGNNWYRLSGVLNSFSGATAPSVRIYMTGSTGGVSTMVSGDGIYIYGAQLEAGSTPSSYIPTNGSSATRPAESITIPAANLPWPTPQYVTGEELVTNGTFDTDTAWTKGAGWTIGSGVASCSGSSSSIVQNFTSVSGAVYLVSFNVSSYVSGSISTTVGGNYIAQQTVTNPAVGQTYNRVVVGGTNTTRGVEFYGGAFNGSIDNISVKEISPLALSIQMKGEMTYADDGSVLSSDGQSGTAILWRRFYDTTNYIDAVVDTESTSTGKIWFMQEVGGVFDYSATSADYLSPGINVPFNIASRHGSTFINGAVDGVALTEDTTPVALPDLENTDLELAYDFMGTIDTFRVWVDDLGDTGIEEASEPSTQATLFLSFDGFDHTSYIDFDWSE